MAESEQDSVEGREALFSAERLVFFSDAVVAIAITLLALELPVPQTDGDHPDVTTNHGLLQFFSGHRSEYLAFLISFLVIARSWSGHHNLFGFVRTLAPGLMRWNMSWLLMIVITPFVTRVLTIGGDDGFQARFILYASVQALSGFFFAMILRSVQSGGVLVENTPPDLISGSYHRLAGFIAGFVLSIPVSFFTQWAYACWALFPLLGGLVTRVARRRSGAAPNRLW